MNEKDIDELIIQACHRRLDTEIPPDEFFVSVADRFNMRRHSRLTVIRIAASIGLLLVCAGSILVLTLRDETKPCQEVTHNSIYLEGVSNVQDRIELLGDTQNEIRVSIDQKFPFLNTTPQ